MLVEEILVVFCCGIVVLFGLSYVEDVVIKDVMVVIVVCGDLVCVKEI